MVNIDKERFVVSPEENTFIENWFIGGNKSILLTVLLLLGNPLQLRRVLCRVCSQGSEVFGVVRVAN